MGKYRKVDPRIWNDAKFRSLSDHGKLATFFLLTHPHMTAVGAMRATAPGLAAELGWSSKGFGEAFAEVCEKGIARYDERAAFVWLPKFLKYNPPENPNVVKAWGSSLELLPECDLYFELIQSVTDYLKGSSEAFQKALPEAFAKGLAKQEQEQEQEQEQDKTPLGSSEPGAAKPKRDRAQQCLDLIRPIYPKRHGAQRWPGAESAIRARLKEGHDEDELIAGVHRYVAHCDARGLTGTEKVQQAATFFGKNKGFTEEWPVAALAVAGGGNSSVARMHRRLRERVTAKSGGGGFTHEQ